MAAKKGRWRRRLSVVALVIVVVLGAAWLLRRPLFEGAITARLQSIAKSELGADLQIASLEGNWLTRVERHGVEIKGERELSEMTEGRVVVEYSPWTLLSSGLAGLRRVTLRARRLVLALGRSQEIAAATAPTVGASAVDALLADLRPMLSDGLSLEVDEFVVRGPRGEHGGTLRATLPSRTGLAETAHLRATCAGAELRAELDFAEAIAELDLDARDAPSWLAAFVDPRGARGGRLLVDARVDLQQGAAVDFDARLQDIAFGAKSEHRLRSVELEGRYADAVLRLGTVAIDANGARFDARGIVLDPAEASRVAGAFELDVDDLRAHRESLPEELAALLPIRGKLRGRGRGRPCSARD